MKKTRNRLGRFMKGHGKVRGSKKREKNRTKARRKNRPAARKTRHPRSSNPKRRKNPSHGRRKNSSHGRTRTVHHHHTRTKNPPYGIKQVAIGVVVIGAGFGLSMVLPMAISHFMGDTSWDMGWWKVGLELGSTILFAGIGYGLGRLLASKRTATVLAGELLIGGLVSTGVELVKEVRGSMSNSGSPMPPMKPAGQGVITPQQLAQAQAAAKLLGVGNISPAQFAGAGRSAADFGPEKF